ncbi:MAG: Chlorosome protein [Candidatus Tokpelaia sp. JSC085]|nr:MAG: Chlorosome protein [Candidatus Tokpelaia sp. JSC085]
MSFDPEQDLVNSKEKMLVKFTVRLADEKATEQLGETLAFTLAKGDLIALHGNLGIGKSILARAIIRTLADNVSLDIPSPTFTLVQVYENLSLSVTHADLYRINTPEEVEELGFDQALEDGLLIVEWPEKSGGLFENAQFTIFLEQNNTGRLATVKIDDNAFKRLKTLYRICSLM